jgi:hypothetical protein
MLLFQTNTTATFLLSRALLSPRISQDTQVFPALFSPSLIKKKKLTHITCCKAAKNTPSKALKNVVHHYNTHISTAAILAPKIVQRHLTKELGGAD